MIESLLAALAVGTIWFWIICVISSIIFIACIEHDHYSTPTVLAIILGIIYWKAIAAFGLPAIALTIAIYAVVGMLWFLFRWFRHVNKEVVKYHEKYGKELTQSQTSDLKNDVSVSQNKSRIMGWIAYWPWSLTWSLTGDFFNMCYDAMSGWYQKIAEHGMSKFSVKDETKKEVITDSNPSWRR